MEQDESKIKLKLINYEWDFIKILMELKSTLMIVANYSLVS